MAVTTTPLGFLLPDGNEPARNGDNHIAANGRKADDLLQGLSAQVASVSTPYNIGLDIDGVPFFQDGVSGLTLQADTDGVPYFL